MLHVGSSNTLPVSRETLWSRDFTFEKSVPNLPKNVKNHPWKPRRGSVGLCEVNRAAISTVIILLHSSQ